MFLVKIKYFEFLFFSLFILGFLKVSGSDIDKHPNCRADLFEENKGQFTDRALYRARLNAAFEFYLEPRAFAYVLHNADDIKNLTADHHSPEKHTNEIKIVNSHLVKANFLNTSRSVTLKGSVPSSGVYNYFIGNDPDKWATKVKKYGNVSYKGIYHGIDINLYCSNGNIKYDWVVNVGGDPNDIKIDYDGGNSANLSLIKGGLKIETTQGDLYEHLPKVYQEINGRIVGVKCHYKLDGNIVSYDFPEGYDKNYPLIIDPELLAATYSGSTTDNFGVSATYDKDKNIYLGGTVGNGGLGGGTYPVTGTAFQKMYNGGNNTPADSQDEITISKFSPDGVNLIYATYLGGGGLERPQSLIANDQGDLYIFGSTSSADFPMNNQTGASYQGTLGGGYDIFIAKLSADGSELLSSTFVGGAGDDGYNMTPGISPQGQNSLLYSYGDNARGEVQIGSDGSIYVASCTQSNDFPVPNGVFTANAGGQDACVFKMNADLTNLEWGTYVGGSQDDVAYSLVLDKEDNIYFAGGTRSNNYPVTNGVVGATFGGVVDGVVSSISSDGRTFLASSYLGTDGFDQAYFVQFDNFEDLYVYGLSEGAYPVQAPAGGNVYSNPGSAQFLHKLNKDLSETLLSTVFGNGENTPNISPTAFLVDTCGLIFFSGFGRAAALSHQNAGNTNNMPVTPDAFQAETDGSDFYFLILERDAADIVYGTYFGAGEPGVFGAIEDHVDGGTARFDKDGTVYQSICACRSADGLPTTPNANSATNQNGNCNAYVLKFFVNKSRLEADADISAGDGCAPLEVTFTNGSTGAVDYVWDFGDGTPRSTDFQPTHIFTDPGTYTVMLIAIDSTKCIIADTAYVDVNVEELDLEVSGGSICPGGSIELLAESVDATTYEWTPAATLSDPTIKNPIANPTVTTVYSVKVSNGVCEVTKEVTVEVLDEILVEVLGDTICPGDSAQLVANIDANTYDWTPITGLNSSMIKNPKASPAQTTTYRVEITTDECKGSGEGTVVVLPVPVTTVIGDTICRGDTAQLYATLDADTYVWTPANDLNNAAIRDPKATPKQTTIYTVEITVDGCKSNAQGEVFVHEFPEAEFTAVPWTAFSDDPSFNFTDLSNDATSGVWKFGDATQEILEPAGTIKHTYNIDGRKDFPITFNVKLYVENDFGCPDSITHQVKITTDWSIYVPNVFSPNGDGINDEFFAYGTGIEEFEMFVYNRWGEVVFRSKDLYEGWNGKVRNKEGDNLTKQDVYVWKVKIKNIFGKTHKYIGHVTLTK